MPNKNEGYTTVYDDVFRTMLERTPRLMIYLINEVFHETYSEEETVILLQNEHLSEERKIVTDSYIKIGNKFYHAECQSNPDGTMAIRMIEYDFMIALQNAEKEGYSYHLKFPNSCVLYLRHNSHTPDYITVTVELSDGQCFAYTVPIVKIQNYNIKEIFEKKLLVLLPYYILRYEKELAEMEADTAKRKELIDSYKEILIKLHELCDAGLTNFEAVKIRDCIIRILNWVAKTEPKIKKEVRDMCGKVIRTKVDDVYDSALKKGHKEGHAEGKKEMAINMYKNGMNTDMIANFAQVSIETVTQWLAGVTTPAK